jgi:cysteinyl-tRNA synthetase
MSAKYLGEEFDIHGGGMDLLFPHHECEMAQNTASRGKSGVRYWMHNNMITINGQKMGKSLGNFITLDELFTGNHKMIIQPYSPMTVRFFILQAHYRSTLDFSNEALLASEKGLRKLLQASKDVAGLPVSETAGDAGVAQIVENIYDALCDDLNTPIAISHVFDAVRIVNQVKDKQISISKEDKERLVFLFGDLLAGVLGLQDEKADDKSHEVLDGVVRMVLDMRTDAKKSKDFAKSDKIRDDLKALGIEIKDTKEGTEWNL